MSDNFIETTSTSWLSRIWGSIVGVLFGLLLVLIAVVLLFWNEGRAVQTARSLAEGGKVVIDATPAPVDAANEGKLMHVSGEGKATAPLVDQDFGVSATGLHLVRVAEMYQWEEEKHEETHKSLGGSEQTTTTYSYNKVWSDHAIDSQKFKQRDSHVNPPKKYSGLSVLARDATLGAFRLDAPVLNLLPTNHTVSVPPQTANKLKPRLANAQVTDGQIYLGTDPGSPQIGDYRISYRLAPAGPISVIGKQTGETISQYQTKAGDRLLMAVPGTRSASDMFKEAERENRILTWILRGVGLVAMWFGAFLMLRPLVVVADVVPLIGDVLGAGAALVALAFALVATAIVVAVAWLWYRPLVSLVVLAIGGIVAFLLHRLAARRANAKAPPTPARV
jgi:Transmembrane protein 43